MIKNLFAGLSISKKLGLFTLVTGIGIMCVAGTFMTSERQLILDERSTAVKHAVDLATAVVNHYQQQAAAGAIPEDKAKKEALETVRAMRYDGKNYLWVNDMQNRMLMHPILNDLEGKDASDVADPNGFHLFAEGTKIAQSQGQGFFNYVWKKPGGDKPIPKRSFVEAVPTWGWVIGSGVYGDTVDGIFWPRVQAFSAAAVLLSGLLMLFGHFISRSICKPLQRAVSVANTVASGDLTTTIEAHGTDETAQLLQSLRDMNASLSGIVQQVDSGINTITNASAEIATGNHDLSNRTEQQASSLEETASAMEQLTGTVQNNAANALHASTLTSSATEVAHRGGVVVEKVVGTMASIQDSARRIVDIISVIDGIAFQTNILALNAAVEAARAGEQGRGFAVVAGEVRTLAQRSAAAAKEIKVLIDDSVSKISSGSELVEQAGATMREIVTSITSVNGLMGEIASASQQQQAGISQVNKAINDMDSTTQQNAALVEQAAAAASAMSDQAQLLREVFDYFKVSKAAHGR